VGPVFEFAGHFWWLIFPFMGAIGGAVRAVAVANERRAQRRLERYRIKQQTKVALAEASGRARTNEAGYRREMTKVLERHDRTDARWLDYEIDIAKLLDFPLMTDMRDPLTIAFHKAKSHADWLRPDSVDDILGDRNAQLSNTATPSASTCPRSTSPSRRRSGGGAATSPPKRRNGWSVRSICCGWRRTTEPHRRSGRARTPGRRGNSTG
jgi:hypothetical protein